VEENAVCAIEEWKRVSVSQKVRKLDKETENIRDHVLKAFKTACFDFVSQLGSLDENVDVDGIYEVLCIFIVGFTDGGRVAVFTVIEYFCFIICSGLAFGGK
jgi:hypothetical protein